MLQDIGIDWRDGRLIPLLYMGVTVTVKVAEEESDPVVIGTDVRQGCVQLTTDTEGCGDERGPRTDGKKESMLENI